ncbi:MAG: hypothetical protein ABIS86_17220 [Streptosporangiaceae bacterium]
MSPLFSIISCGRAARRGFLRIPSEPVEQTASAIRCTTMVVAGTYGSGRPHIVAASAAANLIVDRVVRWHCRHR